MDIFTRYLSRLTSLKESALSLKISFSVTGTNAIEAAELSFDNRSVAESVVNRDWLAPTQAKRF